MRVFEVSGVAELVPSTYFTGERKVSMSESCWWAGTLSTHTISLTQPPTWGLPGGGREEGFAKLRIKSYGFEIFSTPRETAPTKLSYY